MSIPKVECVVVLLSAVPKEDHDKVVRLVLHSHHHPYV
jgi:hypothetical protein